MMSDRPAPDIIMTAHGLTLRRDGVTLLDTVSAQIRRGSITLLLLVIMVLAKRCC